MRANKDEGKPEPHTLAKFANPYFKDTSSMGPPDNDDTKIKRQSCHFEGYQTTSKYWNQKEKDSLAEGVRMQNLENKLFPVLQRIKKLEVTKDKTESESRKLEDLKAESLRIKNLPKEKLECDLEGIDWDRISSTYVQKRSGFQCRLQWCNFDHPDVNRKPWTKEEDKMLIKLAKERGNTWDVIAQKLQTKRTPIHCYERYQRSLNKNLLKSKWTPEDDQQLLQVVQIVGLGNWPRVASFLEGRHGDQCLHRYTQTLQMVKKGKWYEDEDKLLKKAVEKYGACNWNRMSDMVPGRSGPQCRERWVNALDPKINKGPWIKEDDRKLLEYVEKFGRGNWSKIARAMGDRTDNQCWRRWIVICKDDFLYYRQNTLRKKRELVANFTGRRQERPSLEPEDLDIPDVPVVRKRKGPVPLPIEESRARRRATRARFREKKRAEKREAQRREAEKRQVEDQSKETAPSEQQNTAGAEGVDKDAVDDEEEGSSESKKSPRIRKAGGNRTRIQLPHHRVLMKNKQLSKRKRVAEKREKRNTGSSNEEKQVTVTGSLGPFSLLLQAFSIDIPTVLQAIQTTPTASSTSNPSSGANGVTDAGNNQEGEEIESTDRHSQKNQSVSCNPQPPTETEADFRDVTLSNQTTLAEPQNHEKEQITSKEKPVKGNDSHSDRHHTAKNTDAEPALDSQISNEVEVSNIGPSNTHASASADQAGNKSTTAATSTTSQSTRRRAPAIPPLPPCLTTLKTFKSLLLLRPHLQQIAAMLNTSDSTVGTGSRNQMSNVTFINENDVRVSSHVSSVGVTESPKDMDAASGKDAVHESHEIIHESNEIVVNDHVFSHRRPRDTKGSESGEQLPTSNGAVKEDGLSTGHSEMTIEGRRTPAVNDAESQQIRISELPSHVINTEGQAISSCGDCDHVQTDTVPAPVIVANDQIDPSLVQNNTQKRPSTVTPGICLNNTSYRNSYEYRMLSSRFSSLFLWPALLSKIQVKGSNQIGPVFAERHPPPTGGSGDSTENAGTLKRKPAALRQTDVFRRKRPGLAAVRMASSASLSTPGQQMCIVGQGSAIRKETPARQPDDPSVSLAASQLLSIQETSRSVSTPAASTSPCNTRKSKRKGTPVKKSPNQTHKTSASKRRKFIRISDSSPSSEDGSSFSEDDSLDTEYLPVKSKCNAVITAAAMKTRQSSQKTQNLEVSSAELPSDIQATPSTSSNQVSNADEIPPSRFVNMGNSADVSQLSLLVVPAGSDVRPDQGKETAGQQSGAANQSSSKKCQLTKNSSPFSSSKREIRKPDKNRGARWRAMLPNVDSEDNVDQ